MHACLQVDGVVVVKKEGGGQEGPTGSGSPKHDSRVKPRRLRGVDVVDVLDKRCFSVFPDSEPLPRLAKPSIHVRVVVV
jgi:hypothetical protein